MLFVMNWKYLERQPCWITYSFLFEILNNGHFMATIAVEMICLTSIFFKRSTFETIKIKTSINEPGMSRHDEIQVKENETSEK